MKILMISNTDGALYVFRKHAIQSLLKQKHSVSSITSEGKYTEKLSALGVKTWVLDFASTSISLFKNLMLMRRLKKVISLEKPEIVHNFTHKPAIYGTIAAKLSGVNRIFITITGLGTLFTYNDLLTRALRFLLLLQYRIALKFVTNVFFLNNDDRQYFINRRLVAEEKTILLNGEGVDLLEFAAPADEEITAQKNMLGAELGIELSDKIVVVFPARALKEKGVSVFYEAAREINKTSPPYVFIHLGLADSRPHAKFTAEYLDAYSKDCGVFYLGFKDNIRDYLVASDVVVLPSLYREGVPRSLIEALAIDKYVITTDAPGCRETVINGWNGSFCALGSSQDLALKILKVDESLLKHCKGRSRKLCENKFDVKHVNATIFQYYFRSRVSYE